MTKAPQDVVEGQHQSQDAMETDCVCAECGFMSSLAYRRDMQKFINCLLKISI
jgi:hypothetical protein